MQPSSPQRNKMEIENEIFEKRRKISGSEISDTSFPSPYYGYASFNESGPDGFKTQFNQLNLSDSPKQEQYVSIATKKESYEKIPSILKLQQIINNKDKVTQFEDLKNMSNNLSQSQLNSHKNKPQNGIQGSHWVIKPTQIKNESTRNSSKESQNIENTAGNHNTSQQGVTNQSINFQNNNSSNININNNSQIMESYLNAQNQNKKNENQLQNNLFNFIFPSIFQTPLNFQSIIQETETLTNSSQNPNLDPQSVMQMMEAKRIMTKLGFNFDNFYNQKFNLDSVNLGSGLNQNQDFQPSQNCFTQNAEQCVNTNSIEKNLQINNNNNNNNTSNLRGSYNFNQSLESLGGSFNFNQNLSNLSGYSNNSVSNNSSLVSGEKMIGNLSENERRDKVEKYLEKKKQRKWKNIRYKVRQNLADNRQRQQGRFVKSNNPRFNIDIYDKNLIKTINKDLQKNSDILENHSCPPQFLQQQFQQQHDQQYQQ